MSASSSCLHSSASTPRFPSVQTSYSESFNSESTYSTSPDETTNAITIVSEVPPAPNVVRIPLERLLDYDSNVRKVTVKCSKYDEIGNPQARKKKSRRSMADKKWNRAASYANANSVQGQNSKEKLNFMDTQLNSIYNSWEKARIDEQLSARAPKIELVTKTIQPPLTMDEDKDTSGKGFKTASQNSAERFVFNAMMR